MTDEGAEEVEEEEGLRVVFLEGDGDNNENVDEMGESFNPLFAKFGMRSASNLLGCLATAIFHGSIDMH